MAEIGMYPVPKKVPKKASEPATKQKIAKPLPMPTAPAYLSEDDDFEDGDYYGTLAKKIRKAEESDDDDDVDDEDKESIGGGGIRKYLY